MPSPNEISIAQLARLIGTPAAPTVVDVCLDPDYEADPRLIPGAFRWPHDDILALAPGLAGARVVIACQKGLKLSQGAAALLRTADVAAEYVSGGMVAWHEAREPAVPGASAEAAGLWVTRHRPKIDRIACPWLIRRFVRPDARFLFVAPSAVLDVADRFGATPFDIENVHWSHRGEGGERCTFDLMLEAFGLETPALLRLADVVRGADTNRPDLAPQSAGLLAASVGLSRMYKDDTAQLEAGMALYDAFYRWARDGYEEEHDWPGTKPTRKQGG